jgi:hypothetical protein
MTTQACDATITIIVLAGIATMVWRGVAAEVVKVARDGQMLAVARLPQSAPPAKTTRDRQ